MCQVYPSSRRLLVCIEERLAQRPENRRHKVSTNFFYIQNLYLTCQLCAIFTNIFILALCVEILSMHATYGNLPVERLRLIPHSSTGDVSDRPSGLRQ